MTHSIDVCMTCKTIVHGGNARGGHTRGHNNKGEDSEYISIGDCSGSSYGYGRGKACEIRPATEEEYQKAVKEKVRLEQKCVICSHERRTHFEASQRRGQYGGLETAPAACMGCWDMRTGATPLYRHEFKGETR